MERANWKVRGGVAALLVALVVLPCWWRACRVRQSRVPAQRRDPSLVLVTGYCNCGQCCSWKRSWFGWGSPVYSAGPLKGKPKRVGITASGTTARRGTIAADPKVYAFGTRIDVPGYGVGVVEDCGGAVRGRHLDVWFATHAEARRWGSKWLKVKVK